MEGRGRLKRLGGPHRPKIEKAHVESPQADHEASLLPPPVAVDLFAYASQNKIGLQNLTHIWGSAHYRALASLCGGEGTSAAVYAEARRLAEEERTRLSPRP